MGGFTWIDLAIICMQIFQGGIESFFMYHFLHPKYSFAKSMTIGTLIIGISVCVGYLDFSNVVLRQFIQLSLFLALARILYRDSLRQDLFALALLLALAISNDWLIAVFISMIFPETPGYPSGSRLMAANMIFNVTFSATIYIFLFLWKRVKQEVLPQSVYTTMLFPISHVLIMGIGAYNVAIQFIKGSHAILPMVFSVLGSFVGVWANIALFQVIEDNSQKERLAAQLEMMERQTQAEYEYYDAISESREEIRRIRHDFNNQLQTAYSMVRDKEGGREAAQFLKELEQHIEEAAPAPRCANWIVNAVLQEKAKEAKKQDVSLEGEVELPENCGIEKVDLCSVFSNLLDNAIRSAASCEKEKWVKVKSYQKGGYCVVRVENASRAGEKRRDRRKGKEKDEGKESGHGYGLLILQSIAEKYHGEFQTEKADGMFAAEIKLKLAQTE